MKCVVLLTLILLSNQKLIDNNMELEIGRVTYTNKGYRC